MADTGEKKLEGDGADSPTHQVEDKSHSTRPQDAPKQSSGILGALSGLGNLPEWKFFGKELRGNTLQRSILYVASCGLFMFGYDQGVLSALLTLDDFQRVLPLMTPLERNNDLCWLDSPENTVRDESMCTGSPSTQAAAVAIYQIGCFMGAILILFFGEVWGRKSSTFYGSIVMIIGTILQAAAMNYGLFVAGRVIGGIGNGVCTATIPTWQSECAKPEKRGRYLIISGGIVVLGIMVAYWVDYGFYFLEGTVRWRFPIMFQSFFTLLVMLGLCYLPDSPRWLLMRGRTHEARTIVARLSDRDYDSEEVDIEMTNIQEALDAQGDGGFKMSDLMKGGPSQTRRRVLLGIAVQFFQQICGINLITYYATYVFENSLGFGPQMSRLLSALNGTEYWLASLVAVPLIERVGRRKLMLFGAFGMMSSMAILSGTSSTATINEFNAPVLSTTYGVVATIFLFGFNTFFAIGWLGMAWLYPAEINTLKVRIQANALSTCSNWITNFLIVMITPPAFDNLRYNTYTMFAVFCACLIPSVYFFFPEPKGRSLEELDVIFASAYTDGVSPVKRANDMPRLTGRELDVELVRYFGGDVEDARRRSSTAQASFSQSRV